VTQQELVSEIREAVHKYLKEHVSCDCGENYVPSECECVTTAPEIRASVTTAYLVGMSAMFGWLASGSVRLNKLGDMRAAIVQAMKLEGIEVDET
jgi:hypothetical protein